MRRDPGSSSAGWPQAPALAVVLSVTILGGPVATGAPSSDPPAPAPESIQRGDDEEPRRGWIDVLHYGFRLELSDSTDEIVGRADVTARFLEAGIEELTLDLVGVEPAAGSKRSKAAGAEGSPTGDRSRSAGPEDGAGMRVVAVRSGDRTLDFTHRADRLTATLERPAGSGETRTFSVEYRGRPADGLIISENRHGDRTFFGDNWPERARHWLPTVDHPSDKASCDFRVVAPSHYQVVANGLLVEEIDLPGGRRLSHWRQKVPIPTKVMVIGVARFAVRDVERVGDTRVQSWTYPEDRKAGFHDFAVAPRILRFFAGHVGPFPYAKLANVQSRTRYGGMENASAIFYGEDTISGDRGNEALLAHEIAHQWFGDSVTEEGWSHLWLSEGFATYFAQLYLEFTYGRDRLVAGMREARERVFEFGRENPDLAIVDARVDDPGRLLNPNSYQKGAWVLHMLRRRVGEEAFWEGIREYYRRFRDANATTDDFRRVMERISGRTLEGFFDQWVRRPGWPALEGEWWWDPDAGAVTLELRQVQDGSPYRLSVDVAVPGEPTAAGVVAPRTVRTVEIDDAEESFELALDVAPSALLLDPDVWVLMESELRSGDPRAR